MLCLSNIEAIFNLIIDRNDVIQEKSFAIQLVLANIISDDLVNFFFLSQFAFVTLMPGLIFTYGKQKVLRNET